MEEDMKEGLSGGKGEDVGEDGYFSKKNRRRYAKACAVVEAGIWLAKSPDLLLGIMMGSMPDVRNSYYELRKDIGELDKKCRKLGLYYARCMCAELSPERHDFVKRDGTRGVTVGNLWHTHGFMRFDERISAGGLHSQLAVLWGKIHGSSVVDVKVIDNFEKAVKYSVKDMMKGYCAEGSKDRRLLKSRDWLPAGYRAVGKVLVNWALEHRYPLEDELGNFADSYVPYVWEQMRDYVRRWCSGGSLWLHMNSGLVYIDGKRIIKSESKEIES